MTHEPEPDYGAHERTWQAFVKAGIIITGGVIAALALMAIFLL